MEYPFVHDSTWSYNHFFDAKENTPPENETLIIKDDNNEYHIGYFRNGLYLQKGNLINAVSWRPLFYE
jgi:hypothetical protein